MHVVCSTVREVMPHACGLAQLVKSMAGDKRTLSESLDLASVMAMTCLLWRRCLRQRGHLRWRTQRYRTRSRW